MIARLIEYVAKNRFLVVLVTVIVTLWTVYATYNLSVDAIPDLSDVQVIVFTEYPGQAPQVVEDQVTYPLTTPMLSVPGPRWCAAIRFSASLLSISSSRTVPTSTGPDPGCWNISTPSGQTAPRGDPDPRPRCHRRRLDL